MRDIQFIDRAPRVFVAGLTLPLRTEIERYLEHRDVEWRRQWEDPITDDPEALVEAAGRVCYQSWNNPAKRTRQEYLQEQIVGHAHGSVLEHVTINLLVADLPRSSQLELVRHRAGMAYSFESTRFTDKFLRFVIPPRLRGDAFAEAAFKKQCAAQADTYFALVREATRDSDEGTLKKKRAKEAARSILPNALGSDGMVTMNARAARHIIETRTAAGADQSIREFGYEVYLALSLYIPAILADAKEVAVGEGTPMIQFAVSKV